ncbi:MAG: hypothetical protein SVM79_09485 [Chloroflexota bacterium]|nr:hypothetical protein [Chloroflexota bacterium]
MQKMKLLPKGIYKGNWGRKLGTLVLVAILFFGIFVLQEMGWMPVWAYAAAWYSLPFLLVFIVNRWWAIAVSPLACLLVLGLLGGKDPMLLLTLIPMSISGGMGLLIRRLIQRYSQKA